MRQELHENATMASISEDEADGVEDVPLHRMKPFGSGLRRKAIQFVAASSGDFNTTDHEPSEKPGQSISDLYLSMVLKKDGTAEKVVAAGVEICEICRLPLTSKPPTSSGEEAAGVATLPATHRHEASLAHQVCLVHSHPPSALSRSRIGLSILESKGWDPDSRAGLGAEGQGMQYPIKVKQKEDRLGIGVVMPKDFKVKEKPKLLDAKKVRKMADKDKRRTEKLQQQLFGRVDLEKYLGSGSWNRN